MNIVMLVFERITALDVIGPYEVLARLPGAQVKMVGPERGVVRSDSRGRRRSRSRWRVRRWRHRPAGPALDRTRGRGRRLGAVRLVVRRGVRGCHGRHRHTGGVPHGAGADEHAARRALHLPSSGGVPEGVGPGREVLEGAPGPLRRRRLQRPAPRSPAGRRGPSGRHRGRQGVPPGARRCRRGPTRGRRLPSRERGQGCPAGVRRVRPNRRRDDLGRHLRDPVLVRHHRSDLQRPD